MKLGLMSQLRRALGVGVKALVLTVALPVTGNAAEPPATRLLTAPLVQPADAFTNASTTHTNGAGYQSEPPPEIKALARSLGADRIGTGPGQMTQAQYIDNVFNYVRANIETEFRFGLGKGGVGALIDGSGTAFDQAELMQVLLARGNVAASIRAGTIALTPTEFGRWTGFVKSLNEASQAFEVDAAGACQLMADGGIPASCTNNTQGNLTGITIAHVWVQVGSANFDPAYKVHQLRAGRNLQGDMGCGSGASACATAASNAAGGTDGEYSGNTQIKLLSGLSGSGLSTLLNTYAQNLQTTVEATIPDAPVEAVTGGRTWLQTQVTYTAVPTAILQPWAAIPDAFRTRVRIRYYGVDQELFADEIAGRRLLHETTAVSGRLYLDDQMIVSSICPNLPCPNVVIDVNPAYPASSGTYGDTSVEFVPDVGLNAVVVAFGNPGPSRQRYYSDFEAATPEQASSTIPGADLATAGRWARAGQYLSQRTRAVGLISEALDTSVVPHTTIMYVGDRFDIHTQFSSVDRSVAVSRRKAVFRTTATMAAVLEGSVSEQASDSWFANSTPALFATLNAQSAVFADVPHEHFNTIASDLERTSASYSQYLAAGKRLIAPLRPASRFVRTTTNGTQPVEGGFLIFSDLEESGYVSARKGGSAPPSAVDPAKAALESLKPAATRRGAGLIPELATGGLSLAPPPDLITGAGAFPFSLPLTRDFTSAGLFEEVAWSGSVNPIYSYGGADEEVAGRLGGGWRHNYQVSTRLSNDGNVGLGAQRGFDAAAAIAGVMALGQQSENPTFQERVTAQLIADWIAKQFLNNVATVTLPPASQTFVRRVGTMSFRAPAGSADTLLQVGLRSGPKATRRASAEEVIPMDVGMVITAAYDYRDVSLVLTRKPGDTITFEMGRWTVPNEVAAIGNIGQPIFVAKEWKDPSGVRVSFLYDTVHMRPGPVYLDDPPSPQFGLQLHKVENTLGRSLTFTTSGLKVTRVTDESGRYASYGLICNEINWLSCSAMTVTSPGGATTRYEYTVDPGSNASGRTVRHRPTYRLVRWFTASDPATPLLTFEYDEILRLKSTLDAAGSVTRFYPGGVFGPERLKPAETIDPLSGRTLTTFDESSRPIKVVDALGRVSQSEFDDAGRTIRTTRPEGDAEVFAYDQRSNVLQTCRVSKERAGQACSVGAGDILVQSTYPEPSAIVCQDAVRCNRPLSVRDARGAVTEYSWTPTGYLSRILGPPAKVGATRPEVNFTYIDYTVGGATFSLPRTTTTQLYAGLSETTTYSYADSNKYTLASAKRDTGGLDLTTEFVFDGVGNLRVVKGPRDGVADDTFYFWDENRRLTHEVLPDSDGSGPAARVASRWTYNNDDLIKQIDRGVSTLVWNAASSPTLPDSPAFSSRNRTAFEHDLLGNPRFERQYGDQGELLSVKQVSYDALDRVECEAVRMNPAAFGSLPSSACMAGTEGDAPDRITRTTYDAVGQLRTVERGLTNLAGQGQLSCSSKKTSSLVCEEFAYSANGKRTAVIDGRGNRTTLAYDGFDRLIRQQFPTVSVGSNTSNPVDQEVYDYDANGNRTHFTRRDGRTVISHYDALNRIWMKDVPDSVAEDVYYDYDLAGRMTSALFGSEGGQGVRIAYDKAGRKVEEESFGRKLISTYDKAGQRTGLSYPGGFSVAWDYDAAGRPERIREGEALTLAGFEYDELGRREKLERSNGTEAEYRYDGAGRLKYLAQWLPATLTGHEPFVQEISFNPASQIASLKQSNLNYVWNGTTPAVPSRLYDGLNRDRTFTAVAGNGCNGSAGYDCNGNLRSDGYRRFTYDVENRLRQVDPASGEGAPKLVLTYDPLGRLATTKAADGTVTAFQYDDDRLVAEYGSDGTVRRRFVHGPGVDEPLVWYEGNSRRWLHADRQGSIVAWSDDTTLKSYVYGPWGEPSDWGSRRFAYTGQIMLPEVQLYHYKARVYDPELGRFLQTDPIGQDDGLNIYAYVGGDPTNKTDPTGTQVAEGAAAGCALTGPACPGGAVVGATIGGIVLIGAGACAANDTCRGKAADAGRAIGDFFGNIFSSKSTGGPRVSPPKAHPPRPLNDADRKRAAEAGAQPSKGGRTEEGRAAQKHGNRPDSAFPNSGNNPEANDAAGAEATGQILGDPGSTIAVRPNGETIIRAPDGRGIVIRPDGTWVDIGSHHDEQIAWI